MPTQKVEIGFDLILPTGPFFTLNDATKGKLDNTLYPLAGFAYYDITSYVMDIAVRRGKSDYIGNISSGELVVTLNNLSRAFDPLFAASPYYGQIIPKRQVRYSVNGVQVYQGVIDDWNLDYDIEGNGTVSFVASDGFVYLSNQTLGTYTSTSQLSGARVNAILDNAFVQWPSGDRSIATGTTTFGADVIPDNQNVLQYLQKVEESELGLLFIGKDGTLIFRDRYNVPNTGSIVSFTDAGTGIGYTNMSISYGSEDLINEVVATSIITNTELTASSTTSQQSYGIFNNTYSGMLLNTDAQVQAFALFILAQYAQPVYRFREVTVNLTDLSAANLASVLALELGDLVQVTFTPSNVPPAITKYARIIRLTHNVDVSGNHIMTFGLNTLNFTYLVLDNTILGKLDEGSLA